jgi:hypothetical protein
VVELSWKMGWALREGKDETCSEGAYRSYVGRKITNHVVHTGHILRG